MYQVPYTPELAQSPWPTCEVQAVPNGGGLGCGLAYWSYATGQLCLGYEQGRSTQNYRADLRHSTEVTEAGIQTEALDEPSYAPNAVCVLGCMPGHSSELRASPGLHGARCGPSYSTAAAEAGSTWPSTSFWQSQADGPLQGQGSATFLLLPALGILTLWGSSGLRDPLSVHQAWIPPKFEGPPLTNRAGNGWQKLPFSPLGGVGGSPETLVITKPWAGSTVLPASPAPPPRVHAQPWAPAP